MHGLFNSLIKTLSGYGALALSISLGLAILGTSCSSQNTIQIPAASAAQKATVGQRYLYTHELANVIDMSVDMSGLLGGMGMPGMNIKQDITQDVAVSVLEFRPDGSRLTELEFLTIKVVMDMAGMKISYDSQNTADGGGNPLGAMLGMSLDPLFGPLIGKKIRYEIDADNRISPVSGIDELKNAIERAAASSGAEDMGIVQITDRFLLGQQYLDAFRFEVPERLLSPGDTWSFNAIHHSDYETAPLDIEMNCRFDSMDLSGERKTMLVSVSGTMDAEEGRKLTASMGLPGDLSHIEPPQVSGTVHYDPKLGLIVDSDSKMKMSVSFSSDQGPAVAGSPQANVGIDTHLTYRLTSVKPIQ